VQTADLGGLLLDRGHEVAALSAATYERPAA
jgi:hypothetical protein